MTRKAKAQARFTVLAAPGTAPPVTRDLGDEVEVRELPGPGEIEVPDTPAVLLLSTALLSQASDNLTSLPDHVVFVATDPEGQDAGAKEGRLFLSLNDLSGKAAVLRALRSAAHHSAALLSQTRARSQLEELSGELRELNKIGMALMSERDPERVLNLILTQARRLTTSDAGSLYLVEEDPQGNPTLHFLRAQNDTLPDLPDPDFTLPLDRTSLAGCVALTGEPLRIEDAYSIPAEQPYSFNQSFDREHGYRAKSMLVVPMKDHRAKVVGVLQLINRKRTTEARIRSDADAHVLKYSDREVELVRSLAGQAAVSIENGRLYWSTFRARRGPATGKVSAVA